MGQGKQAKPGREIAGEISEALPARQNKNVMQTKLNKGWFVKAERGFGTGGVEQGGWAKRYC